MKYVAPSAPSSIGGVLDNWLRLFRSSLGACWPIALLAAAAGALVQFAITPPPAPAPNLSSVQALLHYWSTQSGPGVFLADIGLGFIALLVYAALLTQQAALVRGEEPFSSGAALAKGLRRVPQILLGWVLMVLIIGAIFVPAVIGAVVLIPFRKVLAAMLFAFLGAMALFVVLIYVLVRLQIWLAVMFAENRSGPSSLGRSWDLVKGNWWRVTGIGFVSGIVIAILTWAASAVIGMAAGVFDFHDTGPDLLVRRIQLIGAVSQVVRLLTMPLLTAVWLAIYQDLILRREGGDLAARTEALGGK
jgi:hypothetical protein